MRRTTLVLDDDLLRQLKKRAAEEGRTLQALANELLRGALRRPSGQTRYRLRLHGWKAQEQPGVDVRDRDTLYDLMDARRRVRTSSCAS